MRVLLSTWGSRGDVEPLLGLALELRAQGVDVRMCAPPDFAERVAEVGVPFVSLGSAVRELVASKPAPAQVAAMLVGQHFDVIGKEAQDCDAVVATGLMPAGVRSVAEHLGIHYVLAGFHSGVMPSLHQRRGRGRGSRSRRARPTPGCCGGSMPSGSTRCTAGRSTRTGPRSGCRRWTTSATTSSPRGHGSRRTRCSGRGRFAGVRRGADRRVDHAGRPAAARGPRGVPGGGRTAGVRGFRQHAGAPEDGRGGYRGDPRARSPRAVSRGWADLA